MVCNVCAIEAYPIERLPAEVFSAWEKICDTQFEFANPYFRPEFSQAVATVRGNAHVGVLREAGEIVGVFPHERDSAGRARPVGCRLSDFHCVIGRRQIQASANELLEGCNLKSFRFDHWPADQMIPGQYAHKIMRGPYLDLSQGYEAYFAKRLSVGATRLRKVGQITRKLGREIGAVTFHEEDLDPQAWEMLLHWKSQQYQRSGVLDIFRYPWVIQVLRALSAHRTEKFQATMMTLRAGNRIAAVHFGMRSGPVVHWWFPAYDAALSRYSPGLIMIMRGAQYFANQGCTRMDLGKGDEPYKSSITSDAMEITEGTLDTGGLARMMRDGSRSVLEIMRRIPGRTLLRKPAMFLSNFKDHYDFR